MKQYKFVDDYLKWWLMVIMKIGRQTASKFFYLCGGGLVLAGIFVLHGEKTSLNRLFFFVATLIISSLFFVAGWDSHHKNIFLKWCENKVKPPMRIYFLLALVLSFLFSWCVVWIPFEYFGKYYYYVQIVYPIIIWFVVAVSMAIILLLAYLYPIVNQKWMDYVRGSKAVFVLIFTLTIVFLIGWRAAYGLIFSVSKTSEDFWSGAGVPILASQVFFAFIVGLCLEYVVRKFCQKFYLSARQVNVILFVLFFIVAGWAWAVEPVRPDFLITDPVKPNYEMYPDYDARNYDLMSQFALIGQGINNGSFFDRVLYPAFLVYLHTFFGQNYATVMAIQAAIFAVFPALMFMLGVNLYNRPAGLILGLLSILRGINQINIGDIIDTAHQKQMLTEFPTAIFLVIVTLLLVLWVKKPKNGWVLAVFSGSMVGLSTLLRPHTLVIVPIFIMLAIWVYRKQTRVWLGIVLLFMAAMYLSLLPWVEFGGQGITIISLYKDRIITIVGQRYPKITFESINSASHGQVGKPDNSSDGQEGTASEKEKTIVQFATEHFVNNIVTAVQILPNTPYYLRTRDVVKKTDLFWKPYWDGKMSLWSMLLLPLNFLLLSFGLVISWRKQKLAGILPLIVMLAYFAVNSLGRTSGGRYLVPADWAILIYYTFGMVSIFEFTLGIFLVQENPENIETETMKGKFFLGKSVIVVLFGSFLLGSLVPLSQRLNSQRYNAFAEGEMVDKLFSSVGDRIGLEKPDIEKFLASEDAVLITGRSLYPRQFAKNAGLDASIFDYYHIMAYPRTIFTVIGTKGESVVVLPRTNAALIPNATDVMVLGCKDKTYIQGWAVVRLDDKSISKRIPDGVPLECPMPEPICDNNNYCR